jgi:transcriptional regulator with XRE-family HTH domain
MQTVKDRIREVRHALGLTQSKFAERISISTSYINGIECGDKKINDRVIRLIGMEFGVSEHWLNTGEGEMYNEKEDLDVVKALSLFKSLDPRHRKFALAQLDELVELQNDKK